MTEVAPGVNSVLDWFTAPAGANVDAIEHALWLEWVEANVSAQTGLFVRPSVVVDVVSEAAANMTAIEAAITAAGAAGIEVVMLPAGTIWVNAANGTAAGSGLRVNLADNARIRFVGQAGTVIKRVAAATMASTSAMVFMSANAGVEIEWYNVTFDGNEANCEYNAGAPYDEEQSANIKWLSGTGTPNAIRFFNCDVGKGRVGDGYGQNVRPNYFMAANCSTTDSSVRRVRSDWQFSRYATYVTEMSNITCNSWESEPSDTQLGARLILSNVYSKSVFDLAGDVSGTTVRPIKVQLTNVSCMGETGFAGLPFVNFYRVHGEAHNCNFQLIDRIQRCKLKFVGGSISVADNGSGVADAVQIWHDQIIEGASYAASEERFGNYAIFEGVTFRKASTVTTGPYIITSTTATIAGQFGPEMVRTALINCHTPEPLDYVLNASRSGIIEITGGKLSANTAIVLYSNDATYFNKLRMEPTTLWTGAALLEFVSSINVAGSEIHLGGEFDGDVMSVMSSGATVGATSVTWHTSGAMMLDASPNGAKKGIPGLRAKMRRAAVGMPAEYRFSAALGSYGQTTWECIPAAPAKGATGNRPTLTSADAGQPYLDTTLAAAGKPIWWTGTAWVDATGAAV